jgi:hypothetical protein
MSSYIQQLSRTSALTAATSWVDGRCGGAELSCAWTSSPQAAWIVVDGTLDDSTAHRLAEALRAVRSAAIRVVDLGGVEIGPGPMAVALAVLHSPRVVLKDPPDGLLEMMRPAGLETCAVG